MQRIFPRWKRAAKARCRSPIPIAAPWRRIRRSPSATNAQVAVDAKNKMIVDQDVTNQVVDMGLLTQTAEPARAILEVATIDVVADRGTSRSRTSRPARRWG